MYVDFKVSVYTWNVYEESCTSSVIQNPQQMPCQVFKMCNSQSWNVRHSLFYITIFHLHVQKKSTKGIP